jgi:ABC-type multidrug transport system fused ATPase/permease subunit
LQIEQLSPFIEFVPKMLTTLFKMGFFGFYLFENSQFAFLSLFGFIYLPVYFLYVEWSGNFWLKWQLPRQKANMDMYSVLAEQLQNIPTIKAFNGYKVASQSFVAQVPQLFDLFGFRAVEFNPFPACFLDQSSCSA